MPKTSRLSRCLFSVALLCGCGVSFAADAVRQLCRPQLDESVILLNHATLKVDLARSDLAAFQRIYELIKGLWDADAIPRMVYLEAKYDFDSARLKLEGADRLLERQAALVEQYRLICDGASQRSVDAAYERYRRADCEAQARSVAAAEIDLDFSEQFLASVEELRSGEVATLPDVIRAELDVEREKKRLVDARARAAACRQALAVFDAAEQTHRDGPTAAAAATAG